MKAICQNPARGATLVEFVIIFPLAVLFVLGLLQTGFIYMAKLNLNHATFMAARMGAVHNANAGVMRAALVRGLSPFYQNSFDTNDTKRLATAWVKAEAANLNPLTRAEIQVLNPSAASFRDFGVTDPKTGVSYIPNDNLEWRSNTVGGTSNQNLRDANLLKLRVVYGYELKIPLMAGIISRVMCSGQSGVQAFGNVSVLESVYFPVSEPCVRYYLQGRIPIESVSIVEMQSRAEAS
jgi:hypothetical protein